MSVMETTNPKYIIGTGWWCAPTDTRQQLIGSDVIRGQDFHSLWYESLLSASSPLRIFMVDSASPIPPPFDPGDNIIEYVRLTQNAGHSTNHSGHYAGWTASVILGIEYALLCDVDYFVYVEQDALLYGRGIIEHCIGQMNTPFMFGSSEGTPQPLQQSFFIIRKDGYRQFLSRIHALNSRDSRLSPEWKFEVSAKKYNLWVSNNFLPWILNHRGGRPARLISRNVPGYDVLPIGFGRTRPIRFDIPYYYFQHGSERELHQYFNQLPDTIQDRVLGKSPRLEFLRKPII